MNKNSWCVREIQPPPLDPAKLEPCILGMNFLSDCCMTTSRKQEVLADVTSNSLHKHAGACLVHTSPKESKVILTKLSITHLETYNQSSHAIKTSQC